jgi:UDP-N-acetylmuramoylalanine--D-glutamate ligase
MELSSYQLGDTPYFKPDVSILLNITPDHLEYHKTFNAYIKAKENILINQSDGDFAIVNYDDKTCRKMSAKSKAEVIFFSKKRLESGVFYDSGIIAINIGERHVAIKPNINIIGMHNIENILAATAASYVTGVEPPIIEKIVSKFKGAQHRIEFVRTLNDADYYNDSKSTNIGSTIAALNSFDKNILIIMGGRDKGIPYTSMKEPVKRRVKSIFLIGEASDNIRKDLKGSTTFVDCGSIENAVKQVFKTAVKDDIVLFSPACASFDQFKNFEERGKAFKKAVWDLDTTIY